jgi:hypothetical protein
MNGSCPGLFHSHTSRRSAVPECNDDGAAAEAISDIGLNNSHTMPGTAKVGRNVSPRWSNKQSLLVTDPTNQLVNPRSARSPPTDQLPTSPFLIA